MFRNTVIVMVLATIGTGTTAGATVLVGYDLNTASGFETQAAVYVQDAIDNGVLPVSPATIDAADVMGDNALFTTFMIDRVNNFDPMTLDGLKYEVSSTDSGSVFATSGNYSGVDYDGSLIRGFLKGDDNVLWTSDDVEIFDGTTVVDGIVGYGIGFNFNTSSALYFESEITLTITATFTSMGGLGNSQTFGSSSASTTVDEVTVPVVPEPVAIISGGAVLAMIGLRRRH